MTAIDPSRNPVIAISPRAAHQLRAGSLWIFSNEVQTKNGAATPGTWCWFQSGSQIAGTGYYNPHSLIAGRVVSYEKTGDLAGLLERRLEQAFLRRKNILKGGAARLVFSESDFIPGLILDGFGRTAVIQSNTAGMDNALPLLESLIPNVFKTVFGESLEALVIRADSGIRKLETVPEFAKTVFGDNEKLTHGTFSDSGTVYAANFLEGQKTGFFLDQRDNRNALARLLSENSGKRMLDLCCYSGGWGLHVLKRGSHHVTFVDESAEALQLARRGLALNGLAPEKARFVQSEIFQFLSETSEPFDAIVADPPAFVKSKKHLPQAVKAYEKLNRLCWRRLATGGLLMTCSCSYHISEPDFLDLLKAAVAKESGLAHIVYRGRQAEDHPVLLSMPETNYLKCVGLRKLR